MSAGWNLPGWTADASSQFASQFGVAPPPTPPRAWQTAFDGIQYPMGGGMPVGGSSPAPRNNREQGQQPAFGPRQRTGMNTSFPMRFGDPQSNVIDNPLAGMGTHADWESDWQSRWNAEEAKAGHGAFTGPSREDFITGALTSAGVSGSAMPTMLSAFGIGSGPAGFSPDATQVAATNAAGLGSYSQLLAADAIGRENFDRINAYEAASSTGYVPKFGELNAERDRLQPLWENNTRVQQAYDNMAGANTPNAVMPEGYTKAGFGQVSGQVNPYGPALGAGRAAVEGAVDGISNDWLSGVYDPNTQQATGAYKPPTGGGLGGLGGIF